MAHAAWMQVCTFLQNVLSSILAWVGMIWQKACQAWPSLETSFNSGVTITQNILGDMAWFVHEALGIFGDVFDRLLSGLNDLSLKARALTRTIGPNMWEIFLQIFSKIRMFIRTVIAEIRKTFSS